MNPEATEPAVAGYLGPAVGFALLLAGAWAGLTAPVPDLHHPESIPPTAGAARAFLPVLVAAVGLVLLLAHRPWGGHRLALNPVALLAAYALIGLLATILYSADPHEGLYFGFLYLGVPLAVLAALQRPHRTATVTTLVHVGWAVAVALAPVLLVVGIRHEEVLRQVLSGSVARLFRSYSDTGVPGLLINSNGAGRFAAIGAIVALARLLRPGGTRRRAAWAIVLAACVVLIALTLSRSSLVGLAAALFVVVFLHRGAKPALGVLGVGALALLLTTLGRTLLALASRSQGLPELLRFSGRPVVWQQVWDAYLQSPWIGHGFQADRLLLGEHVHNAALHALFQAGLVGGLCFLAAWVWAWTLALRLGALRRFGQAPAGRRDVLVEATAVLAFLTLRSVPESTGAFYGVDLLILVPIFGLFTSLERERSELAPARPSPASAPERGHILVCAFACRPPHAPGFEGGEDLLGWKIVQEVGARYDVHVLTDAANRRALAGRARPAADHPIVYHFLDLPRPLQPLRRVPGGLQLYAYLWQIEAWLWARELHARHRFDIFHHLTYANDWMACHAGALLDVPYVRGPGGGAHRVPPALLQGRRVRFRLAQRGRSLLQAAFRLDPFFRLGQERAQALFVCTRESLASIPARWAPKARLLSVNGVDAAPSRPSSSPRNGNPFTVLSAGKLLEIKGFDLAVAAFARFAPRAPHARLLVAGDGPQRRELESLARRLGVASQVRFLGWRPHGEVVRRMATSDVFLFPSLRDGGGGVVVEAMAVGTPVVTLDLGGPGLHVTDSTGIKVSASDGVDVVERLAAALEALHASPARRRSLGRAARLRAHAEYRWSRHADRLAAVYERVIRARRAPPPPIAAELAWIDVLGTPIVATTLDEVLAYFDRAVDERRRTHVCVCSVNNVVTARDDPELARAHATAGLCLPDGFPLAWLAKRRGSRRAERIRGLDLVQAASAQAAREGHRVYLYGGGPGVARRAAARLKARHRRLRVVGTHAPPFRALTLEEDEAIVRAINAARPDIVWVGLSTPKQEKWMAAHRSRLRAPLLVGVGAAFDFVAGTKRPAPPWMGRMGLEWLWRFLHEPRRLWRRVFVQGPTFVALSIGEGWRRRRRLGPFAAATPRTA